MGSPDGSGGDNGDEAEKGRTDDEGPRQLITFDRPFAIGRFAVTVAELRAFTAARAVRSVLGPARRPAAFFWELRRKRPAEGTPPVEIGGRAGRLSRHQRHLGGRGGLLPMAGYPGWDCRREHTGCRRRRSGNIAHARAPMARSGGTGRSRPARPITMAIIPMRAARRVSIGGARSRSMRSSPIPGGSIRSTAMFGNGAKIRIQIHWPEFPWMDHQEL